jgi:hypothetical protein
MDIRHQRCKLAWYGFAWVVLLIMAIPGVSGADEYRIRLLGGIGSTSTEIQAPEMKKTNSHYAAQLLQYIPNDTRRRAAGIEVGSHTVYKSAAGNADYTSVGILVETLAFRVITAQIGTVGYFAKDSNRHPFGVRASIGMDHDMTGGFFLSGFFRHDVIFALQKVSANSLEVGIGYHF